MFEAYSVAVRVQLAGVSTFTTGLMRISEAFAKAHGGAEKLEGKLAKIRALMAGGAFVGGAGALGLAAMSRSLKSASDYAHQLNIINMAGVKQADIAQMVAASWKNTGDVMTTTATQNLRAMLDLRNVLGSLQEAKWALPIVTKIGTVMAASSEANVRNNAEGIAFDMAKALDIIGAAKDPATFARQASLMSQVVTAFQNRVTPKMYQGVFAMARQAKYDLSDDFKYGILPTLMLENAAGPNSGGGGSRGVGPMLAALYRITNQGIINRKALPLLQQLGWVAPGTALRTTTSGTTVGPMIEAGLAASNPFLWAMHRDQDIKRVFGQNISPERERQIINQAFRGNQLAAALMTEFVTKPQNFLRDAAIIRGAMPYDKAYAAAMKNDPETKLRALQAQWENVKTQFGITVLPLMIDATQKLTVALRGLSVEMERHPRMVKAFAYALGGLSILATLGGAAMLARAGFSALDLVLLGIPGKTLPLLTRGLIDASGKIRLFANGIGDLATTAAGAEGAITTTSGALAGLAAVLANVVASLIGAGAVGYSLFKERKYRQVLKDPAHASAQDLAAAIAYAHANAEDYARQIREHRILPQTGQRFLKQWQSQEQRLRSYAGRGGVTPSAFHGSGRSPVVAPMHVKQETVVKVPVHLDGRQIAEVTAKHFGRAMGYGQNIGRHDPNATLPPAALGYV